MIQERIGPAGKGEAGVHLGGEPGLYTKNAANSQDRGPAPLHLLVDRCRCSEPRGKCACVPHVVSIQRNGSTIVGIRNPVWGHGAKALEFLGGSRAAKAYADTLWGELRALAWREHDRRLRIANGGAQ